MTDPGTGRANDPTRSANDDAFSAEQLRKAVQGGTRAVLAAQIGSQILSLAVLAGLYRLLDPAEFGLLGMVVPLLALARMLAGLGLNVATVQRATLSDGQLSSLFWINLLAGFAAALVTAAGGPALAWAYGTPALIGLCLALSGTLVAAAAGAQHQALLERRMRLGPLAVCRLVGQLAGGAGGIAAAFAGWGVWALVVQQYLELIVLDVCVWLVAGWRPRSPAGCESIGALLGFGGYFAGSNLLFFLALHLDKVLLAAVLGRSPAGQAALGMYTQAFQLMFRPVYLVINPIAGVMLPGLSRAHQDKAVPREVGADGYERMVVEFYRMIGIVLLPGGLGLWLVARDVMPLLGGAKWTDAGLLLEAFAPAILVQGFISLAGSVFASAGRADRLFWGAAVATLLMLQGYAAGCWLGMRYGPGPMGPALGMAWSYSLVNVLILAGPYLVYCFRTVGVRPSRVLRGLRGPLIATLCMGLLVGGMRHVLPPAWPLAWQLALLVTTGVLSYSVLARSELTWMWQQLAGNRQGE